MKTVLITGCNGLVGSILTNKLLKLNYKVIGLSTGESKIKPHKNFTYEKVDLTNHEKVSDILNKYSIDIIVHLAAIAHLKGRKNIDWDTFYKVNTKASIKLFEIAIDKKLDIFFASTVDIYGNADKNQQLREDKTVKPITDYAKSKHLVEQYLQQNIKDNNYLIARFAPVYGKRFKKDIYKRIYFKYPTIAFKIGKGIDYHFLSINNLVEFILKWLEDPSSLKGITNVCDGRLVNSVKFLELEKKINSPKIILYVPKLFLALIYRINNLLLKVIPLNLFKKVKVNFGKLLNPPSYSLEKMERIYKPKWNLENTIYQNDESDF